MQDTSSTLVIKLDKNARRKAPAAGLSQDFVRDQINIRHVHLLPKEDVLSKPAELSAWIWPGFWAFRIELIKDTKKTEYFCKLGYAAMREINGLDPKSWHATRPEDTHLIRDYLRDTYIVTVCSFELCTEDSLDMVPMHPLARKEDKREQTEKSSDITEPGLQKPSTKPPQIS